MTKQSLTQSEPSASEIREHYISSVCPEFIGQYKRLYKGERTKNFGLYHLYALDHLCRYSEHFGLDCRWVYDAFVSQLCSKSKTILRNYYIGGFISTLIDYGSTEAEAIEGVAFWLGRFSSQSKVRAAHKDFKALSSEYAPLELAVLFKEQKLKISSAFINSMPSSFPQCRATAAYKVLSNDIEKFGLIGVEAPVKPIIKKNK